MLDLVSGCHPDNELFCEFMEPKDESEVRLEFVDDILFYFAYFVARIFLD